MAKLLRATLLDKFMDAFIEWPHDERQAMISNLQSADALLVKVERRAAAATLKPEPTKPDVDSTDHSGSPLFDQTTSTHAPELAPMTTSAAEVFGDAFERAKQIEG